MSAARHTVVTVHQSGLRRLGFALGLTGLLGLAGPALAATKTPSPTPTPSATSTKTPASSKAPTTVTIEGKGFGHGVGLAQDGALTLGQMGKKLPQILGAFYPGTRFGSITDIPIRAAVEELDASDTVVVQLPAGGSARVGTSGVTIAKGGEVALSHDDKGYHATLLDPPKNLRKDQTTAGGQASYSVFSKGLELIPATGRSYAGSLAAVSDGDKLRAINTVPIESYLYGLGEVRDPSWPAASLQAQAVAARTYAVHSLHPGAIFDVWDDDRSQVYLGASAAYPQLTSAVDATRGLVLTYDGAVADTVYSASGGGVTATAAEGFGDGSNEPYLVAATYPTSDPHAWTVTLALTDVAARLNYPGTLTNLAVLAKGPSGRPAVVALSGSAGTMTVTGLDLYSDLGLRSNLFTFSTAATGAPVTPLPRITATAGSGPSLNSAPVPLTVTTAPSPTQPPATTAASTPPTTIAPATTQPATTQPATTQPSSATAASTPTLATVTGTDGGQVNAGPAALLPVRGSGPVLTALGAPAGPVLDPTAVRAVGILAWLLAAGTVGPVLLRRRITRRSLFA